jgi:enoyl-CoA hydratase/carnithine racemase
VAHITMNQPERGNPLDRRFAEEFNWLATECTVRPEVRSVLIDAAGRFFSVGGDLNALTRSREDLARFVSVATSDLHMGISRFARMNAPVIIAVHGMAAGVDADALANEARALAARLAKGPTLAYGEAKNLLLSSQIESLEAQLESEARAMARVTATEDAWNAMCAVLAKQKPTFQGR